MKEYLTVAQAAKHFKKNPSTVRRWITGKKLSATKTAGKFGIYLISRSDMLEYMMEKVMQQK